MDKKKKKFFKNNTKKVFKGNQKPLNPNEEL